MSYGSNYPPPGGYGGYGAYGGYGGYASSGPPPPPGPGGPYSAYNVHQYPSYGNYGYSAGSHAPPGGQHGYTGYGQPYGGGYGGGYSYGYGAAGAVPGFTVPAPQPQGQWGPPMDPSNHYNMMQNTMSNMGMQQMQWEQFKRMGLISDSEGEEEEGESRRRRRRRKKYDDDEDEEGSVDMEEERRKMEERARRAEEKAKELQEKLEDNDALKKELKANFVAELMRRQEVNGTFEETYGTIIPFDKYEEEDPVAKWFQEHKGDSIAGERWDPMYDSEYLRHGIRGWGTDEQKIISVLTTRCNSQRNRILKEYKTCYGRDLIDDLKSDLSGDFREAVLAMFETPARYDAWSIKKAIYGLGTKESTLIEILMTRTNAQIREMVDEYNQITYHKQGDRGYSIERDIKDDCSGPFKRLLISACQGNRRLIDQYVLEEAVEEVIHNGKWTGMFRVNYDLLCNVDKCRRMARELHEAGEDRWGTDDETFNRIFSTMDYYTLRVVLDEYVKVSQRDILNSVDRETSGSFRKGLLAIAQSVKCRPMYFAERLYKSMKGAGTKDSTLIRNVISRSEIDLMQIKGCFLEKYHQTLWNFIKHDTSGDYKRLLQAVVGRN